MKTITKEYFEEKTGTKPTQDELERCNCDKAGQIGHMDCGWCEQCNLPRFICNHKENK